MPPNTVSVARPTKWGNPFRVGDPGRDPESSPSVRYPSEAAALFREWVTPHVDVVRERLAGKNLACWCALDQPCHADVLLELANAPEREQTQGGEPDAPP